MRLLKMLGQGAAATALLAFAVQSAQADISYTWVEAGASRLDVKAKSTGLDGKKKFNMDLDGAYLRGSFSLGDNLYLLGSYSENSGNRKKVSTYTQSSIWGGGRYQDDLLETTTDRLKGKISQLELGVGFHLPIAEQVDMIGEVVGMHWHQEAKLRSDQYDVITTTDLATGNPAPWSPQSFPPSWLKRSSTNRSWGGKALAGIRANPVEMLELWGKVGYMHMEGRNNRLMDHRSALANVGMQFKLTENLGLVGEADLFEKDANHYRVGARFSF